MKVSIFTTMTNPGERNDPWEEALDCYSNVADEIVVKGQDWPYEFSWEHIGETFHSGFLESKGDWAIKMDLDYFFHENKIDKLHEALFNNRNKPAVAFPQYQFFSHDRYQIKTLFCIALNKKEFPDIKLNGGGDLCLPTLNGKLINPWDMPIIDIPVWQYDSMFRTKEIISEDRARFARAWNRKFKTFGDRGGGEPKIAFDAWFKGIEIKYRKHTFKTQISSHPKFIKNKLSSIEKDSFGYDVFGLKDNTSFSMVDTIKGYKLKSTIKMKGN